MIKKSPQDPPDSIGAYRIEGRLGAGGMGAVYRAYHERLARSVALKRIHPDMKINVDLRERFLLEARTAAQLSHPNIVQIYDVLQEGADEWIVMELVEGRNLAEVLVEETLTPRRVVATGMDLAKGLAAAHARQIVHRDLKGENTMITPEGRAKILDFGLAKLRSLNQESGGITGAGSVIGTPRCMSPEQAQGLEVDHRSDLFSLGVLLYEALLGISPFQQGHGTMETLRRICAHRQDPAHQVDAAVPEELSKVIDRLLEKDPDQRPQSAEEVLLALQRISGVGRQPVKILVVDDEPDFEHLIRTHYRRALRKKELHLEFAGDGEEALDKLRRDEAISILLTDINMPKMDGLALLREIRTIDRSLVAIVVSAYGDMENIRIAMNRGAFDFLIKPINFEDLEATRSKAMEEAQKIRERQLLNEENRLLDERNRFIRSAFSRYLTDENNENIDAFLESRGAREITVLSAGLKDVPSLDGRVSAADLQVVLDRFYSEMVEIVFQHEGMISSLGDGGLSAVFGVASSQKDKADSAVDCALAMRVAMASIRDHCIRCGGPELRLSIGIDTGEAELRKDQETLQARPFRGSARLRSQAEEGRILASETTLVQCEVAVETGELDFLSTRDDAEHGVQTFRELIDLSGPTRTLPLGID